MQTITPFLWFNDQAEQAVNFYVSVFKNASITTVTRYGDTGPGPKGSVMTAGFEVDGQEFVALNGGGGPQFTFSPAISFVVNCETQEEVDYYWERLSAGGQTQQCGWLQDRYGLSWQIVPTALPRLLKDPDTAKAQRVMQAMMRMTKIDIAELERARDEQQTVGR
jgi:predicted 3-demethylubiquinone-9 3-methyltransferase (glyoxalase superfamily)